MPDMYRKVRHPNIVEIVDIVYSGTTPGDIVSGNRESDSRTPAATVTDSVAPLGYPRSPSPSVMRFDLERRQGDMYVVMELATVDLDRLLHGDGYGFKLHLAAIKSILYQVLKAFKYLHSANVIHRDLKPANILLSFDGAPLPSFSPTVSPDTIITAKVADFGFSRVFENEERQVHSSIDESSGSPAMGRQMTLEVYTQNYRAPELLLCNPYGTPADVWYVP